MTAQTFQVRLGNSFQPSKSPGSRALHTIRYNFEPDSVDKSRGSLQEDAKGEVTLTFAHATMSSDEHVFKGQQTKAKDSEFLLIFDPSTGEYVLEKLSSTFNMRNIRQAKRPHAAISNLEDSLERSTDGKTPSKIVGSATTAGLMKPPVNFTAKMSPPASPKSSSSQEFSDLEDLLDTVRLSLWIVEGVGPMGDLFDGWTIAFLKPTFSKKRLEILLRIIKEQKGKVLDMEACDKHLLEHNDKHVVIADAEPSQNLTTIFEECAKFPLDGLSVYSAQWISSSIKTGNLCPLSEYLIKSQPPVEPQLKRIKEDIEPVSLLPSGFVNSPYECMRPTPLDHKNKGLVAELTKIAHHRYLTGNSRSELSYNKAIATIKSYPKDIVSVEEAEQLHGIGPKIVGFIGEYLSTGKIKVAEELANDPEAKVIDALTKVHGVGPKTARQWYTLGIRSIDDLKAAVQNEDIVLHTDQTIGLQYYEDFAKPMTRKEVEEIFKIVSDASTRIFGDTVKVEITGGYRRGKELSGDADILIHPVGNTPSKTQIMDALITELKPKHIKAIMQHTKPPKNAHKKEQPGLDVCFMAFQAKPGDVMRRVDFIVSTRQSYAFSMLGWTGSRQFERAIRLFAKHEHGLTLTDHDLTGSRGEHHEFSTEKEIFDYLGVPYLDPTLRHC